MPLVDVVVDTDVLMHAENEDPANADKRDSSRDLIAQMRRVDTQLCLDEGFDVDESRNRSAIASEYFEHLPPGSRGYTLFEECALNGRVRILPTKLPAADNKAVNQAIWDKSDRKFAKVAANSGEKVLVTHNDRDFGPATEMLRRRLGVSVLGADACCGLL